MRQENPSSLNPFLLTFFAGAAVGGVVLALIRPRLGSWFRRDQRHLNRRTPEKVHDPAETPDGTWNGIRERRVLIPADRRQGGPKVQSDPRG